MHKLTAIALLVQHGIRPFYSRLSGYIDDASTQQWNKARQTLVQSAEFLRVFTYTTELVNTPGFISHPKIDRLVSVVVDHFSKDGDTKDSRIMISAVPQHGFKETTMCLWPRVSEKRG